MHLLTLSLPLALLATASLACATPSPSSNSNSGLARSDWAWSFDLDLNNACLEVFHDGPDARRVLSEGNGLHLAKITKDQVRKTALKLHETLNQTTDRQDDFSEYLRMGGGRGVAPA